MSEKLPNAKYEGESYTQYSRLNVYEKLLICGVEVPSPISKSPDLSSGDYEVLPSDSYIRAVGTGNITLPASRVYPITIYAATGSVTLSETPENRPNPITVGNTYTLVYDEILGGYYVA